MAITWHIEVANSNPVTKCADVYATRIDSEVVDSEKTYVMTNTPFETLEQRTYVLAGIKSWVEQDKATELAAKVFKATFEQDSKIALELWETTRI